MRDAATGRARGFAFVEMSTDEEAQKAASELKLVPDGGPRAHGQRGASQARRRLRAGAAAASVAIAAAAVAAVDAASPAG